MGGNMKNPLKRFAGLILFVLFFSALVSFGCTIVNTQDNINHNQQENSKR